MNTIFRSAIFATAALCLGLFFSHCKTGGSGKPRVLIFNKSEFYVHECMPAAVEALQQICQEKGWETEVTDDAGVFVEEKLRTFAAVIFLNTAGDVLNPTQEIEFERYIQAGGGFVGIHTAIDTEHNWKWYGKLTGARFNGQSEVQPATLRVLHRDQPATQQLDSLWQCRDEWFNLSQVSPGINVLIAADEKTYQGGNMGDYHPLAWYHEFDGGRAFVSAMGHTKERYQEQAYRQFLAGAIQYAVGDNKPLQFKAHRKEETPKVSTGFVKTELACNLYEPMAMKMLPDDRILFIERRGAVKLFDPKSNSVSTIDEFKVFLQNEEGMLGLAVDPKWSENHWIYIYYSPEKSENSALRLSRFVFDGAKLDRKSETVLLEIPTDRTVHNYHAAGYLEFDAEGYLYLSAGDNTDHYPDGYSSIDERPGNSQYDAQKSAANSMDLRGKILRIKPLPDGSYICPAGNLFNNKDRLMAHGAQRLLGDPAWDGIVNEIPARPPASISMAYRNGNTNAWSGKGRPEIYVMGVRNPFRFTVDNRRRLLIWGEPGPDAGVSDSLRGPEGYDEFNVARTAGYYGWPYFIGNNAAYRNFNFETNTAGAYFDPAHPFNDSPNNTGTQELPPARPALIWYPFRSTTDFPLVANGTRCAMGGPVYYADQYPAATRFPDQFDGKVIIYEWMRNWMLAIGLDSLDRLTDMQPLAENVRVARPIDMLIDKNGALWVLEYGTEWYAQNPDACLSRIDYVRGNGPAAATPAGNAAPTVHWDFGNKNRSFYQPGDVVQYQIQVSDSEDGSLADGRIPAADVAIVMDYLAPGARFNTTKAALKPSPAPFEKGKKLVEGADCKACHALDKKINGPAYQDIALRYKGDKSAPATLVQKIIKGGQGNWGQTFMIAHPQITAKDAGDMVRWILSLTDFQAPKMQGAYTLSPPPGKPAAGTFVFHAAYTDRGTAKEPPAAGSETILLRPAMQQAEQADSMSKGLRTYKRPLNNTSTTITELKDQQCLMFRNIDLRGVRAVSLATDLAASNQHSGGGQIELRLDGPEGRLAGTAAIPAASASSGGLQEIRIPVDNAVAADGALHKVFLVVHNAGAGTKPVLGVDWLRFDF